MKKYIDAEKLKEEIQHLKIDVYDEAHQFDIGARSSLTFLKSFINSLQKEQPDFPTSDKECEEFLATHSEVEVPDKYKTPDWLWKKREQPEVDIEKIIEQTYRDGSVADTSDMDHVGYENIARYFYELGLNARKEEKLWTR